MRAHLSTLLAALGAVILLTAIPAYAGHGNDSVCRDAGLVGDALGLCTAYCSALDCTHDSGEDGAACQAVKAQYVASTGASTLPCEQKVCKCWDPAVVFERIASVGDPEFVCYSDVDAGGGFSFVEYILEDGNGDPVFGISLEDQQDYWSCIYFDGFDVGDPYGERDDLTAEDVEACRDAFEPPFECSP